MADNRILGKNIKKTLNKVNKQLSSGQKTNKKNPAEVKKYKKKDW